MVAVENGVTVPKEELKGVGDQLLPLTCSHILPTSSNPNKRLWFSAWMTENENTNNHQHFHGAYYVPGTCQSALHVVIHLIFITTPWNKYHYFCCTDGTPEPKREYVVYSVTQIINDSQDWNTIGRQSLMPVLMVSLISTNLWVITGPLQFRYIEAETVVNLQVGISSRYLEVGI